MKKVLNEFVVARVMGLAFIIDIWGGRGHRPLD
jgi:hypothetical protein